MHIRCFHPAVWAKLLSIVHHQPHYKPQIDKLEHNKNNCWWKVIMGKQVKNWSQNLWHFESCIALRNLFLVFLMYSRKLWNFYIGQIFPAKEMTNLSLHEAQPAHIVLYQWGRKNRLFGSNRLVKPSKTSWSSPPLRNRQVQKYWQQKTVLYIFLDYWKRKETVL